MTEFYCRLNKTNTDEKGLMKFLFFKSQSWDLVPIIN